VKTYHSSHHVLILCWRKGGRRRSVQQTKQALCSLLARPRQRHKEGRLTKQTSGLLHHEESECESDSIASGLGSREDRSFLHRRFRVDVRSRDVGEDLLDEERGGDLENRTEDQEDG